MYTAEVSINFGIIQSKNKPKTLLTRILMIYIMAQTINVSKEVILDLIKIKEEFDAIVESLELMSDKEFMNSYKKSKEQIKKRRFADWN